MTSPPSAESAPSIASRVGAENPHFVAIGGAPAIAQLVERFYHYMDTLEGARAIRALHPADLEPVKAVLRRYLAEWMGGPADYSAERGHPRLRRRHQPFAIGAGERDAWLDCMRRALIDVVLDVPLRAELSASFTKVAEFLRNDAAHEHVRHSDAGPRAPSERTASTAAACLELGEPSIDRDHRTFVELVERSKLADDAAFPAHFERLVTHTAEHFAREKGFMVECRFPALAEHDGEHRRVLAELTQLHARVGRGSLIMARAFVRELLGPWFELHVSTMDSALVSHMKAVAGPAG